MKKIQKRDLLILRQVESRWLDFNSNDINLFKPLPAWEQIVSDIETLLDFASSSFVKQEELDKEYQVRWDEEFEEALRESGRKIKELKSK